MTKLQVIDGIQKEKVDYYSIYNRMFMKALKDNVKWMEDSGSDEADRGLLKKIVFSGVRKINHENIENYDHNHELLTCTFQLVCSIKGMMSLLTPREFMTIFPIDKEYNGRKYQTKDYFSAMKYMNEIDMDKPLKEGLDEFLWRYWNWKDTAQFECNVLSLMSAIRKAEGQKGMMEEFLEGQGIDSYTLGADYRDKEVLVNNSTGEVQEVTKKKPR